MPPALRRALAASGLALLALAGCEQKKTFKHPDDWPAPNKAEPKPIKTDTPEGTAEAIQTRLDDIVAATHEIYSEADARRAADRMKAAYADLETYVAKLKQQEPSGDGPHRKETAERFLQAQQDLAKSVADLLEKDQKIVAVIGEAVNNMPLVENGVE